MEVKGKAIIRHTNGWACSNKTKVSMDLQVITLPNGKMAAKTTDTAMVNDLYNVIGEIGKGTSIEMGINSDGNLTYYKGEVTGIKNTDIKILISEVSGESKVKELTRKIKGGN